MGHRRNPLVLGNLLSIAKARNSYIGCHILDARYYHAGRSRKTKRNPRRLHETSKRIQYSRAPFQCPREVYATQDDCGHQRASLSRGTLEGAIVTCPLHRAKFDVTTGRNVAGINFGMPPDLVAKLPPEMVAMFQKTGEIISDIQILPLKTYKVEMKGDSVYLDNGCKFSSLTAPPRMYHDF